MVNSLDSINLIDLVKEKTKDAAELSHKKINELHDKYISKVTPNFGKYGDAAKFVAEMAPGVSEYNAIKDGDWYAFAIAAGIDLGAIAIGTFTAGAGYAAVKGGSTVAKIVTEKAVKEVAEMVTEKAAKEVAEVVTEKVVKEVTEVATEKAVKEVTEVTTEKAYKEITELGTEKVSKEVAEKGVKETADNTLNKVTKEVGKKMDKGLVPDYFKEVENYTNREIKPVQLEKLNKALEEDDFFKLDPDKTKIHRQHYNNEKEKLIEGWENNTGDKWPVYSQDVLNNAGEVLRMKGQPYDAHHLIELSFGGPNEWWNLHPAAFPNEHQGGIHAINSVASLIF